MAYDTKTISDLETIAGNLRIQIALHPDYQLERVELKECERWIELRRLELRSRDRRQREARSGEERRKANIPPPPGSPVRCGQDRRQVDRRSETARRIADVA